MTRRMLIDATHAEEIRVAVVDGTRLDDFDYEVAGKKQLKGNIYLAKVTRVEPSLQAAFVEYGGNRHGFLPFAEIHPDYYQIPVADREAMLRAQAQEYARQQAEEDAAAEAAEAAAASGEADGLDAEDEGAAAEAGATETDEPVDAEAAPEADEAAAEGEDEAGDEAPLPRPGRAFRNYKIQEVIKRRQIMLIQVVKEERGNKGAALTTYLSLAGRYCVLMPNSPRGGGISRKIANAADRRRMKELLSELNLPDGMSVILRTAGLERSKDEIKRDLDYLLRLWDSICEDTLKSIAPELIHEEGDLVKRSLRDTYSGDIDEVLVAGDGAFRTARDFMQLVMPSHARRVQPYREAAIPLFGRFQIEAQIDAMHSPVVQLRSGGYVVINQTEALVAIDVNSGKATRERHIEETALKTNMEAAEEIARQLRLRDLAGLIVIDFIDMEENRHNHQVERKLKEAMKADRARIQIGRISSFGLLELSRQRLRPSLTETAFARCPHCEGTGLIRSVESAALLVLRAIEEEALRRRTAEAVVHVHTRVALYLLNYKRDNLARIAEGYGLQVVIEGDEALIPPAYRLERLRIAAPGELPPLPVETRAPIEDDLPLDEAAEADEAAPVAAGESRDEAGDDGERRRRRRRRRRRGGRGAEGGDQMMGADGDDAYGNEGEAEGEGAEAGDEPLGEPLEEQPEAVAAEEGEGGRRRRGRRGGRRRRGGREDSAEAVSAEAAEDAADDEIAPPMASPDADLEPRDHVPSSEAANDTAEVSPEDSIAATPEAEPAPRKRAPRKRKSADAESPAMADGTDSPDAAPIPVWEASSTTAVDVIKPTPVEVPAPAAIHARRKAEPMPEPEWATEAEAEVEGQSATPVDPDAPKRKGWWQRLLNTQ